MSLLKSTRTKRLISGMLRRAEEQQDLGRRRIAGRLLRQTESLRRATRQLRSDRAFGLRDDALERLVGIEHDDVLVTAQEPPILAALSGRFLFAELAVARLQHLRTGYRTPATAPDAAPNATASRAKASARSIR